MLHLRVDSLVPFMFRDRSDHPKGTYHNTLISCNFQGMEFKIEKGASHLFGSSGNLYIIYSFPFSWL